MFKEAEEHSEGFAKYLEMLAYRFTMGSMELEEAPHDNIIDSPHALKLLDNLEAFKQLFFERTCHEGPLVEKEIKALVNIITSGAVGADYRRKNVMIIGADNELCDAKLIPEKMMYLMHNYKDMLVDVDPFEREAFFHIEFVHIHPFDDGNGRTARLVMAYNLCRQNIPPAIITNSDKADYNRMIREKDYPAFADFIRQLSMNESHIMEQAIKSEIPFFKGEQARSR